ncbi:hypothetical protein FISHEDRAFT_59659 [Fistulina hepatica ATCC 64428]|uniref:Uncharacterized protein n=1 Tax=Fistulina hepatica ATCC 64428 TaxID=1128425 RepID=A0A0D7A997_9AGAR|nr:hypothetical protein FISHEDRAFT_59659 [Fistulina hepatica ATCC 64428]
MVSNDIFHTASSSKMVADTERTGDFNSSSLSHSTLQTRMPESVDDDVQLHQLSSRGCRAELGISAECKSFQMSIVTGHIRLAPDISGRQRQQTPRPQWETNWHSETCLMVNLAMSTVRCPVHSPAVCKATMVLVITCESKNISKAHCPSLTCINRKYPTKAAAREAVFV